MLANIIKSQTKQAKHLRALVRVCKSKPMPLKVSSSSQQSSLVVPFLAQSQVAHYSSVTSPSKFNESVNNYVKYMDNGDVVKAAMLFEDQIKDNVDQLSHTEAYALLRACASPKMMEEYYAPNKCYVDMLERCWLMRGTERVSEATHVYKSLVLVDKFTQGDIFYKLTYALFLAYASGGKKEALQSFDIFTELAFHKHRTMELFVTALRVAATFEDIPAAEEIHEFAMDLIERGELNSEIAAQQLPQLHAGLLDAYAEGRSKRSLRYFESLIRSSSTPVILDTFTAYIKACLFLDERPRLIYVPQLLHKHGIPMSTLPEIHRQEIQAAIHRYSTLYEKPASLRKKEELNDVNPLEQLRHIKTWGQHEDRLDKSFRAFLYKDIPFRHRKEKF